MSSDYGKPLQALYEEASNERDPKKLKQLTSEISPSFKLIRRAGETARG